MLSSRTRSAHFARNDRSDSTRKRSALESPSAAVVQYTALPYRQIHRNSFRNTSFRRRKQLLISGSSAIPISDQRLPTLRPVYDIIKNSNASHPIHVFEEKSVLSSGTLWECAPNAPCIRPIEPTRSHIKSNMLWTLSNLFIENSWLKSSTVHFETLDSSFRVRPVEISSPFCVKQQCRNGTAYVCLNQANFQRWFRQGWHFGYARCLPSVWSYFSPSSKPFYPAVSTAIPPVNFKVSALGGKVSSLPLGRR